MQDDSTSREHRTSETPTSETPTGETPTGETPTGETLTSDQKAIDAYYHSSLYRDAGDLRSEHPSSTWVLDRLGVDDPVMLSRLSFWAGLLGLNAFVVVTGFLMPFSVEMLEPVFGRGRPKFVVMTLVMQTILFPPLIGFSFATATPMFWYGSVITRFLAGMISVTPGCVAFFAALCLLQGSPPDDFFLGFAMLMFAMFLAAGLVALAVQMWSPYTLSQMRASATPIPPPGTRAMMEMTAIAALGFAIFLTSETLDYIEGIYFFGGLGLVSSLAIISVMIAFMRRGQPRTWAAVTSALSAFATAFFFCAMIAVMQFGWSSIGYNFLLVAFTSVYGAGVIGAVMWVCLWWLRSCGWSCVSREEENRRGQPMRSRVPDRGPADV